MRASRISEHLPIDQEKIRWLNRLVSQGEGLQLEFKAKAAQPDKIVKEMIAFANTKGGTLLIGVNDDGYVSGVKYPEEESPQVIRALNKFCRPRIKTKLSYIRLTDKKWVVVFDVWESKRKPVKFLESKNKLIGYIRFEDKTLQASREAEGILRLRHDNKDISFAYGEIENRLLKIIDEKKSVTLPSLFQITGIQESVLSKKIVLLAATNVIGWKPQEPNDIFYSLRA
jgi:predicted HTH transcriptional regulator